MIVAMRRISYIFANRLSPYAAAVHTIPPDVSSEITAENRARMIHGKVSCVAALFAIVSCTVGCRDTRTPVLNSSSQVGVENPASDVISAGDARSSSDRSAGISFADVTVESGVHFVNRNGEAAGHCAIVESLGGGIGVMDFDRDGWDDMLLPGGGNMADAVTPSGLPCGLFRNCGNWRFVDVSQDAGVADPRYYSHGVACGDFNNDGFPDAVITGYGGLQLFRNQGDGSFKEVSGTVGLTDSLWSSSAAWGDITADGNLDLYVCHYVNWGPDNNPVCLGPAPATRDVCPPRDFEGLSDTLYAGQADGTFDDVSAAFAITPDGKGLGVIVADLDNDRDLDIYVTNDTVPNVLYRNDAGKSLVDWSLASGASLSSQGVPEGSMGVQLLDYNQDGVFDIWVANYERETNALYEGQGNLLFRHVSQRAGISSVASNSVGWGTLCFDADHDGDEDVFIANGHVIRYPRSAPLSQWPLLLENQTGQRFRNVASEAGDYMTSPHMARGCAASDFDNDGDLDMAVMHTNEPLSVLRNTETHGGFLSVELIGLVSSRDAVGAIVEVVTAERRMVRQWIGGGSYASTNGRRLHFGIGVAKSIEQLTISWPSGNVQTFRDVLPNRHLAVVETRTLLAVDAP